MDLGDDASVAAALEKVRGDFGNELAACIHLAAYFDITGEPNPLYEKVNVEGSRRLITALQAFDIEQFIYASSMLVHEPKPLPGVRIDESSPLGPTWPYPQSKADAEQVLRENRGDIPVVFLRFAGVYDDKGHSAFLAEQIARNAGLRRDSGHRPLPDPRRGMDDSAHSKERGETGHVDRGRSPWP